MAHSDDVVSLFPDSPSHRPTPEEGELLQGRVTRIDEEEGAAFVEVKGASWPLSFLDLLEPDVRPGAVLDVLVVKSAHGLVLSHRFARRKLDWDAIVRAQESGSKLQAVVEGPVMGGYRVRLGGVQAFLPASLVMKSPPTGATLDVEVFSFDQSTEQVLVSERPRSELVAP